MTETSFSIKQGFAPDQQARVAALFWQAFRGKLNPVLKPEARALQFLERVINPEFAFSASASDGSLIGVAGFKSEQGLFVGGELEDLQSIYGAVGGLWRGLLLSTLERSVQPGVLLMDGIFVAEEGRGQGVGSALLDAIKKHAVDSGCRRVRLDVIDSNPRAKALYERSGFSSERVTGSGPLKYVFGFKQVTTMSCDVTA